MRIYLINQFYEPDIAPTGLYLSDLAQALSKCGHEVHVFCARHRYQSKSSVHGPKEYGVVKVHRLYNINFPKWLPGRRLLQFLLFYLFLICVLLFRRRPDFMLATSSPPLLEYVCALIAKIKGCRLGLWIMDLYPEVLVANGSLKEKSLLYKFLLRCNRKARKKADLVIVIASEMAEKLGIAREDLRIIPLWGRYLPGSRAAADSPILMMYSGNMGRGHRFNEILRAIRRLEKRDEEPHDLEFIFCGQGKRRQEIEMFKRYYPDYPITLTNYVPEDYLADHLSSAACHFVSLDENWQGLILPCKLANLFCLGIPVIYIGGKDNSLWRWVEKSGGGWTVGSDDTSHLHKILRDLTPELIREKGEKAFKFGNQKFDYHKLVMRMCHAIESFDEQAE